MKINNKRKNVYFIGSSALGLKLLANSKKFQVVQAICLESRINKDLFTVAKDLGLIVKLFKWHKGFCEAIQQLDISIPFLIYQLDMLIPKELTESFNFYNVHRGCLKTNRGPNPDIWPILLGHKTTSISLHKINEKIDSGLYIDSFEVNISLVDDAISVKEKLEGKLPCIIESLALYLDGKIQGEKLNNTHYYPWITEEDFTLDPLVDSIDTMKRKIACQKQYNGAILNIRANKFYIKNVEKLIPSSQNNSSNSYSLKEDKILWKNNDILLSFTVNNTPYSPLKKYPLPVKRI